MLAGHSLGGAFAMTLLLHLLTLPAEGVHLDGAVTFGAPLAILDLKPGTAARIADLMKSHPYCR